MRLKVYYTMVPQVGLEPTRIKHWLLRPAWLPITPPGQVANNLSYYTPLAKARLWLRGTESHRRSSGYEPDEILLLHPAITIYTSCSLVKISTTPSSSSISVRTLSSNTLSLMLCFCFFNSRISPLILSI